MGTFHGRSRVARTRPLITLVLDTGQKADRRPVVTNGLWNGQWPGIIVTNRQGN